MQRCEGSSFYAPRRHKVLRASAGVNHVTLLLSARRPLVHPRINPAHAAQIRARTGDLRKIFLVRGEIHAPRGFLGGCTMRAEVGDLFRDVCEIALERGDEPLIAEWRSMSGQHQVEIQILQSAERRDPLVEISVAHVGQAALHQISSANDFLAREKYDGVAGSMAAPEEQKLDLPRTAMQGKP